MRPSLITISCCFPIGPLPHSCRGDELEHAVRELVVCGTCASLIAEMGKCLVKLGSGGRERMVSYLRQVECYPGEVSICCCILACARVSVKDRGSCFKLNISQVAPLFLVFWVIDVKLWEKICRGTENSQLQLEASGNHALNVLKVLWKNRSKDSSNWIPKISWNFWPYNFCLCSWFIKERSGYPLIS